MAHPAAPRVATLQARLDDEDRDTMPAGLRAWPPRERGVSAGIDTVWASLARMGLAREKGASGPPGRTGRT